MTLAQQTQQEGVFREAARALFHLDYSPADLQDLLENIIEELWDEEE